MCTAISIIKFLIFLNQNAMLFFFALCVWPCSNERNGKRNVKFIYSQFKILIHVLIFLISFIIKILSKQIEITLRSNYEFVETEWKRGGQHLSDIDFTSGALYM